MKTNSRYPIEFFTLVALVICVPSFEALKNILWLAFVVTWLINRIRDKNFGGAWDLWDSLIGLWIVSGYLISAFAGLHGSEWGGANDILRYGSIFWATKRSGYSRNELLWLAVTVVFSTTFALGYGLWNSFAAHTRQALQLKSVGHVNHSAIYLAISYGALLSLVLAFWRKSNAGMRIFGSLLIVLFAVSIFVSASRGAVGVALLTTLILGIAWLRRSKYPLIVLLVAGTLLAGGAYMTGSEVVQKQEARVKDGDILSHRDAIWNTALVAWRKFPLFGVGMSNYSQVNMDNIKMWLEESGTPYVESEYWCISHAHSLYMNTLAERGLVGAAVLLSVLLCWFFWLVRFAPGGDDEDLAWALWGGSFGAWFTAVGIGLINTTLHHEHAILSVLLLGMWLSYLKTKPHSTTP